MDERVTFHCPINLQRTIEAVMSATDPPKTQVIVDALHAQLRDEARTTP